MQPQLKRITGTLAILALLSAPALAFPPEKQKDKKDAASMDPPKAAVAVLVPTKGNKVFGVVTLKQEGDAVQLKGEVHGLTPGKHGFHIHTYGDLRDPQGKAAGGHFDPHGHPHGGPDDEKHHVGDLGNIEANEEGVAKIEKSMPKMKLHFIIGRSVVVHGDEDDLKSQPSGDAGPRVALGVIGIAESGPQARTAEKQQQSETKTKQPKSN